MQARHPSKAVLQKRGVTIDVKAEPLVAVTAKTEMPPTLSCQPSEQHQASNTWLFSFQRLPTALKELARFLQASPDIAIKRALPVNPEAL